MERGSLSQEEMVHSIALAYLAFPEPRPPLNSMQQAIDILNTSQFTDQLITITDIEKALPIAEVEHAKQTVAGGPVQRTQQILKDPKNV